MGTQQSGVLDFKLADLARDGQIIQSAKSNVDELLKEDPDITSPNNKTTRQELIRQMRLKPNWSNIS